MSATMDRTPLGVGANELRPGSPKRRRRGGGRIRIAACVAILLGVADGSRVFAHEIGKTQVTATLRDDRTYQIDMTIDPDALLAKLEALSGVPASGAVPPIERARRIEALQQTFLARTVVAFDGTPVEPRFEYRTDDVRGPGATMPGPASQMATVRLVGIVPSGARTFTWRSSLVYGSYPLVIKNGGEEQGPTQWLEGGRDSEPFPVAADIKRVSRTAVARQYLALGFTHILPKGLDHILFVVGIFLLTTRWRPVLTQVTAFTLAHSITLGLTIYGIVSLPPAVVEPLIALSIAYVAIENLVTSQLKPWRVALVFGFGLLHGMGFAGVLRELGLPRSELMTALVTFNLGVEGGQLTVIGMAFLALACWRSNPTSYRRLIVVPASLMIAITGFYWTVQRLTAA